MAIPVLICDDSSMARKQTSSVLPEDWDVQLHFAANGAEALKAIEAGQADILFLDLNMPVMDGYELLKVIRQKDLPTLVIVVSGDIQPDAKNRVMALGAMDFLQKPVKTEQVAQVLQKYGVYDGKNALASNAGDCAIDLWDCYREVANVAMGRAADLLARLLDVFVEMPVPKVNMIEVGDLWMALEYAGENDRISAVCQGFIGSGIAGEALVLFNESSFHDIALLLRHEGAIDDTIEIELLMDISNTLIGALLQGLSEQLDVGFSQGHPMILGRHVEVKDLHRRNSIQWKKTLAVEMGYTIENHNISCDLLLLFTEDSKKSLDEHVSYLSEA